MNNCIVLIYHRVVELEQDPHRLAVHPHRFEEQIQYLKDRFTVISLQTLVERMYCGQPTQNCAVITFDDGYADNLYFAKPILEKYGVPAAVFATIGQIGSSRESWWDELERLFLLPGSVHKPLRLLFNNREYARDIRDAEAARQVNSELHPLLKYLPRLEREKIMDDLFVWAGLDRDTGRKSHRFLNEEELRELARGELVEIGSHSLTHTVLAMETAARKRREIKDSGKILEEMINRQVLSFSYPFGLRRDIDAETIRIVKDAGYVCGIANIQGTIDEHADVYRIPRRLVRDWKVEEFAKKLDEFLNICPPSRTAGNPPPRSGELQAKITAYVNTIETCKKESSPAESKKKVKNILFINYLEQKGGAAKVCRRIYEKAAKKRFNTVMLVGKKQSNDKNVIEIAAVKTKDQRLLHSFQEQEGWLDVFHYSSFNIKHTRQFQAADIIHLHNLQKNYFSILTLPEITCLKPTIWTLHDMLSFTGHCSHSYDCIRWQDGCKNCPDLSIEPKVNKDAADMLYKLKKIVYSYADFTVVCPSNWLKSKAEQSILKEKEILSIHNGVDEKIFNNTNKLKARKRLNLPLNKRILLFVVAFKGLKHHLKGGDLLQQVLKKLPQEDLLLLIIGKSDLNSENIKTLPYIKDEKELALYYSAADLLLFPSLAENCPLVVLESLSCGTPVVAFKTGGIPELIRHKETGYLAEYKNINDLTQGVEFFLKNPSLQKKASKQAREAVLQKFTLNTMVKKYLDLYKTKHREFCERDHTLSESYRREVTKLLKNYHR
jgi:glycosyltransferase involved in cell wall biosynthesis/peptidoglycan/xylan/chitin deacetylase (PgdA/CDA1 family)